MSTKMKVLMVAVDVTNLTHEQCEDLRLAMEAQAEVDHGSNAPIINSETKVIDLEELYDETH